MSNIERNYNNLQVKKTPEKEDLSLALLLPSEKKAILEILENIQLAYKIPNSTTVGELPILLGKNMFKKELTEEEKGSLKKNFDNRKSLELPMEHVIGEISEDIIQIGADRGREILEKLGSEGFFKIKENTEVGDIINYLKEETKKTVRVFE